MENQLKIAARHVATVLSLSLLVTILVAVFQLHDMRVLIAVIAGMRLGQPLFDLTGKIKALKPENIESDPK